MNRVYSLFLFAVLHLIFIGIVSGKNPITEVISYGDSILKKGFVHQALHEYKRAYFFSSSFDKEISASRIADCSLLLSDYDNAKNFYDSAFIYSANDEMKADFFLKKIAVYMFQKDYGTAILRLNQENSFSSSVYLLRKNLYYAMNYFVLEQFDTARYFFLNSIPPEDTMRINSLKEAYGEKIKLPNSNLAFILSLILPGSGQIYVGDYQHGINSLALVGGILVGGVYAPNFGQYLVVPFFYRYYIGGAWNAKQIAIRRKEQKKMEFVSGLDLPLDNSFDSIYLMKVFEHSHQHTDYKSYFQESKSDFKILLSISFLFYKYFISSQDVNACVFEPSCSVYMMESVKSKGLVFGTLNGFDRLLRCHRFVNEDDYELNKQTGLYYDAIE
ncbi:MAG: membrane protein insertion efficiency factor YidD [Bacteroidales bacterium]|nr:membrane protein insertion efficiency factor YidD [Bacteroidales bacterium]MBN2818604.1 membrane protein insertion efficiency factor YidD [Bacteroidales bacterium]